jgi:hypothetical protein
LSLYDCIKAYSGMNVWLHDTGLHSFLESEDPFPNSGRLMADFTHIPY